MKRRRRRKGQQRREKRREREADKGEEKNKKKPILFPLTKKIDNSIGKKKEDEMYAFVVIACSFCDSKVCFKTS